MEQSSCSRQDAGDWNGNPNQAEGQNSRFTEEIGGAAFAVETPAEDGGESEDHQANSDDNTTATVDADAMQLMPPPPPLLTE